MRQCASIGDGTGTVRDDEETEFAGQYSVADGLTYVLDAESMGFGSGNDIRVVMNEEGVFVLGALSAFLSTAPDDAWIKQDNDVLAAEIKTLFDFLAGGLTSIAEDTNVRAVELGLSDIGTRYGLTWDLDDPFPSFEEFELTIGQSGQIVRASFAETENQRPTVMELFDHGLQVSIPIPENFVTEDEFLEQTSG